MNYVLLDNKLNTKDFIRLRSSVGWGNISESQAAAGIKNSLLTVCVKYNDQIIGMGRIVGDGVIICYLQDVVVLPDFQGNGIGKAIVERLLTFIKESGLPDTNIKAGLFSSKGKEEFYKKLGFNSRPNENRGAGMEMIMNL